MTALAPASSQSRPPVRRLARLGPPLLPLLSFSPLLAVRCPARSFPRRPLPHLSFPFAVVRPPSCCSVIRRAACAIPWTYSLATQMERAAPSRADRPSQPGSTSVVRTARVVTFLRRPPTDYPLVILLRLFLFLDGRTLVRLTLS